MAITRVAGQAVEAAIAGTPLDPVTTGAFPGAVTVGNLIVVAVRWFSVDSYAIAGVSGGGVTTFTRRQFYWGSSTGLEVWTGIVTSAVTTAVSVDFTGGVTWGWVKALEYSAGGTWDYDTGDDNLDLNGTGDLVVGPISTANAEELVVVVGTQVTGGATYTAGADFTLVDGDLESMGGIEEYITSGTLTTYTAHLTSSSAAAHFVLAAAFKYTAPASGQFARPASDVADGNWLNQASSNVNLYASIDETTAGGAGDDDYIRSGASPSNDTCTVGLSSIGTPQAGPVTLRIRTRFL